MEKISIPEGLTSLQIVQRIKDEPDLTGDITDIPPEGTLLPELVQWLPSAGLGEPIGTLGAAKLRETTAIVTGLITS